MQLENSNAGVRLEEQSGDEQRISVWSSLPNVNFLFPALACKQASKNYRRSRKKISEPNISLVFQHFLMARSP